MSSIPQVIRQIIGRHHSCVSIRRHCPCVRSSPTNIVSKSVVRPLGIVRGDYSIYRPVIVSVSVYDPCIVASSEIIPQSTNT